MGMFDWVNVEVDCPKCGEKVGGFQSKDAACNLLDIDPMYVSDMYSECRSCNTWIRFSRNIIPTDAVAREKPYSRDEIEAMGFSLE